MNKDFFKKQLEEIISDYLIIKSKAKIRTYQET